MQLVLTGAIGAMFATTGLFFLRFYIKTQDKLLGFFAAAFALLATERFLLGVSIHMHEEMPLFYMLRLSAFLMIIFGIMQKNRAR